MNRRNKTVLVAVAGAVIVSIQLLLSLPLRGEWRNVRAQAMPYFQELGWGGMMSFFTGVYEFDQILEIRAIDTTTGAKIWIPENHLLQTTAHPMIFYSARLSPEKQSHYFQRLCRRLQRYYGFNQDHHLGVYRLSMPLRLRSDRGTPREFKEDLMAECYGDPR